MKIKKKKFAESQRYLSMIALQLLISTMEARGPIQDAIDSGAASQYNRDDCTWRRGSDKDSCPDPDVHLYLFTPKKSSTKKLNSSHHTVVDYTKKELNTSHTADWLRQDYDPDKESVILIHGYTGEFFFSFFLLYTSQLILLL